MQDYCFFIGHREAPESLRPVLQDAVREHIERQGVTAFLVGHYGRFDEMAAQAVLQAKEVYPGISLHLLLPYHPTERPIELPRGYDGSLYPENMEKVPRRLAIVRANRYAIDHAGHLIAYAWHPASNARELLEYAQKREKRGLIRVTALQER